MSNKRDLFFYFILNLKKNYSSINPNLELNRYHVLKMLFIATVKDNRLLEGLWEGLNFNNFYALPNWPVESDCYNFIYVLWWKFEKILKNTEEINKEINNEINERLKKIIEESTAKIGHHLYEKDDDYLIDYTHTFESWKNAWLKALHYWKKAFYIEPNDIKNDK